jgi:carbon monoxide dehydrogenase subunit G
MKIEDQFRVNVPFEQAWNVLLDIERIAPCMPGAQLTEVEGNEYRGIVKVKVGPITAQYKGAARIVEADQGAGRVVIKAEGRDTRGQGNASATVTATLVGDGDFTQVSIDTDLNVTGKVAQFGRGVMADVSSKLLGQFVSCLETDVLAGDGHSEVAAEAPPAPAPATVSTPAAPPASTPSASAPTASTTTASNPAASTTTASTTTSSNPAASGAAAPAAAPVTAPPAAPVPTAATSPAAPAATAAAGTSTAGVRKIEGPEAEAVDLVRAASGAVAKRLIPTLIVAAVVIGVVIWRLSK